MRYFISLYGIYIKMSDDLLYLINALKLTKIKDGVYQGENVPFTRNHIFGGQILAQALSAALQEVPEDRVVHSSHGYFIRLGNTNKSVIFNVENIRDGGTFNTRRVVAEQDGKAIFITSLSFQRKEKGHSFQLDMPALKAPLDYVDEVERWNNHSRVQADPQKKITFKPVEIRHTGPMDWFESEPQSNLTGIWIKTRGKLSDSPHLHQSLLAYFSDTFLYAASLRPHGLSFRNDNLQAASLDHSVWFHDDFRADEWLYYRQEGIWSGNSRGLNLGRFYTQDGRHIASTSQEGLMRVKKKTTG